MGKQALSYIDGSITIEKTFVEIFSNISTNSTQLQIYAQKENCKMSLNIANTGKKQIAINKGQLWHSHKMVCHYILKK